MTALPAIATGAGVFAALSPLRGRGGHPGRAARAGHLPFAEILP